MKIFLGGDITPTPITVPAFDRGDIPALFGSVGSLIAAGDARIANLECALTESDTPIRKKGPNLRGKPSYAEVLRDFGLTAVGLSNNHVFDFGTPGLCDTEKALSDAGIPYTGIGENERDARRPLFLEVSGKRVALVCVAEHEYSYALPDRCGVWGFDPFDTMEDISNAKENADYVIVLYHGGKEQSRYPSPRLRRACQAMVRAGADFVSCQHSHCVGVYEDYRGAGILYGQGNFNFVGYIDHPHWRYGLLLELNDTPDGRLAPVFHPLVVTPTGVTLAEGGERERELAEFAERSRILQDTDAWLAEWHAFCVSMQKNYREAVAAAFRDNDTDTPAEIFPHYLDCEAHTDVWRELYPTWHKAATDEQGSF
ncbi:MAG: CapA family protein [Clostridiaceae bacterium]|nr:CapA family protein [Clostridiaceae bacterium]